MRHSEERQQELLEANNRSVMMKQDLRIMLRKCRDQFAFYAREHRGKIGVAIPLESEDLIQATIRKAEANEALVAEIDAVLEQTSPS